jgi:hypothetical protein
LLRVFTFAVGLVAAFLAGQGAEGIVCAADGGLAEGHRSLRVAYFAPSDVEPHKDYAQRLTRVMLNIQEFYRTGMRKNGFGNMSFPLSLAEDGTVNIVMVRGEKPLLAYDRRVKDSKNEIREEVSREFSKQGLDFEREVVIVFQALLQVEPNKTTEIGPFIGGGNWFKGSALVYDDPRLDSRYLSSNQPDPYSEGGKTWGDFNTGYIGGAAHELGHAFGIGHDAESELVRTRIGRSLMGRGNHDYGEELRGKSRGAFLSAASAFPLSLHPLFTQQPFEEKEADFEFEKLRAVPVRGGLRVFGTVRGNQPAVGLVAFNDPASDPSDYDAIGWPAKIKTNGDFAITLTGLTPDKYELRFRVYGEHGQAERFAFNYQMNGAGQIDTSGIRPTGTGR